MTYVTDLLAAIRTDLATSPFTGEGHRKVWARLRILRGIRVSKTRVLRLMGENQLLSTHWQPKGVPNLHDGTIITDRPNELWGTTAFGSRPWTMAGYGSSQQWTISMPVASAFMP